MSSGTSYVSSSSRDATSSGQWKSAASSRSPYRHPISKSQQDRKHVSNSSGHQSNSSGRSNGGSSLESKSQQSTSSGQRGGTGGA